MKNMVVSVLWSNSGKGVICGHNTTGAGIANGYGIPNIAIQKRM